MFWQRFAYSLRHVARVEVLAILGLQLVLATVVLLASFQVGGPLQPWEIGPQPSAEIQWRVYYPLGVWLIAAVLLMPAFVYVWGSLNYNVFGVPLPATALRACLRLAKAYAVLLLWTFILFIGLYFIILVPSLVLGPLLGEGARGFRWVGALAGGLGALAVYWLFLIHCFYPLGLVYQPSFTLRAARALSRGWRWSIFGLMLLWSVAVLVAQIPFLFLITPEWFIAIQIGGGLIATLVQMPFVIAFSALYFQASAVWTPRAAG